MEYKPFDLEAALAGKPVRLRDGSKAYVKYVMPDDYTGIYPLRGYYKYKGKYIECSWVKNGNYRCYSEINDEDIISMWQEPRPRVQLDLPCPLKEPQEGMWFIISLKAGRSRYKEGDFNSFDNDWFEAGRYFATEEDAQEWIEALKGARR